MRLIPLIRSAAAGLSAACAVLVLGGCAGQMSAPTGAAATAQPTATAAPRSTPSPTPTSEATPTTEPTDDQTAGLRWNEVASFEASDGGVILVTDVSAWEGGFVAIGHEWTDGFIGGPGAPRVWSSPDGRAWDEITPDFGTTDLELRGLLRPATGGVVVVGEIGRQAAQNGEGAVEATAWRSQDGEAWTRLDLPTEIATAGGVAVASGAIGFVISTASEVWYSADVESWQLVHEAADGVAFRQPTAGDEGFVVSALDTGADRSLVFASGDGLTWYEADAPGMPFSIAPFGGDWLTVAFTDDASTIAVFRSANGLDWSATADVNDLTGPDGPKAGEGPKSEITEALVSGEGRVAVLTLGWNHCCARPSAGVQVHVSTDGDTWQQPGLPETAYVTATATDGEVVVIAGHVDRGERIAFWLAER